MNLEINGNKSNLNTEQYHLVRGSAFKNWFGDWESLAKAKTLGDNISGIYRRSFKNNEEQFLFEMAVQANSSEAEKLGALSVAGKELIEIALKLYPNVKVGDDFFPVVSKVVDENSEPFPVFHGTKSKEIKIFNKDYIGANSGNEGHYGFGIYFSYDIKEAITYTNKNNPNIISAFLSLKNPFYGNDINKISKYADELGYKKEDVAIDPNWLGEKIKSKDLIAYELFDLYKKHGYDEAWKIFKKNHNGEIPDSTLDYNDMLDWAEWTDEKSDMSVPDTIIEEVVNYFNEQPKTIKNYTFLNYPHLLHVMDYGNNARYITEMIIKDGYDGIIAGSELIAFESNQIKLADGTNTTFDTSNPDVRFDKGGNIYGSSSRKKPYETIIFDTPIVGVSGAKLISYQWTYDFEEYFNTFKGETATRRVSDWDKAIASADTGKNIVHQFTVEMPDGEIKTVSSESVLILLGYTDRVSIKSFPSLVNSIKTLAKQKTQLKLMEAQQNQYDELRIKFENENKPEIKIATFEQLPDITKFMIEKGNNSFTYFSMGDVIYGQDNESIYDYNEGMAKYISSEKPNKKTIEQLNYLWVDKRITENGGSRPSGLYDLKKRVERQERKVKQITEQTSDETKKFINGGELINDKSFEDISDYGLISTINFDGLVIRMSDLLIAEEDLSHGKKSVTPNLPVEVTFNLSTGEKELVDGYHRYLDARGGSIDIAKNNGSIKGSIKARVKFEINGKNFLREANAKEISEAYHKDKNDGINTELVRLIEESVILTSDMNFENGGILSESDELEKIKIRKIIRKLIDMLNYTSVTGMSNKSKEDLFIDRVVELIYQGKGFKSKLDIERVAMKEFDFTDKQKVRELTEYAVLIVGRDISSKYDIKDAYPKLVSLYSNQPYSTHRTNISVELGQFSTPIPIAYLMGVYVGINKGKSKPYESPKIISAKKTSGGQTYKAFKGIGNSSLQRYEVEFSDGQHFNTYRASDRNDAVEQARRWHEGTFNRYNIKQECVYFEPCAGNGALSVAGNVEDFVVNELDTNRYNNLIKENYKLVLNQDANLPFNFDYKFDGMLANPPFASTSEKLIVNGYKISGLEQQIIIRSLRYLKDEAKVAFIIGGHTEYDSAGRISSLKDKAFLSYLYSVYHIDDVININGSLYGRQGTTFPIRVILIRGKKDEIGGFYPLADTESDNLTTFSTKSVNTFEELFNRIAKSL